MNSNSNYQIGQATHREYDMLYSQDTRLDTPATQTVIHGRALNALGSLVSFIVMISIFVQA